MGQAHNNGWDFVEVGKTYQYKESRFIAMVTILEDNSNEKFYSFIVQLEKANEVPHKDIFEITHVKNLEGYFFQMIQLCEKDEEYKCDYIWHRNNS